MIHPAAPTAGSTTDQFRCSCWGGLSPPDLSDFSVVKSKQIMNFMSGSRSGFYQDITSGGASSALADDLPEDSDDHLRRVDASAVVQKEHMFDKVVTPSDVGKLNRLVIPKQHAEKYFPLDSSTNEKGLLLNFEDRNGKPWRFRYSYWNSSQSYVMTKGWSRFVKEKKLDAGDIVSFQRGVGDVAKDRLFIDWRRRPDAPELHHQPPLQIPPQFSFHRSVHHPWSPLYIQSQTTSRDYYHPYPGAYPFTTSVVNGNPCPPGSIVYLRGPPGGGGGGFNVPPPQRGGSGEGGIEHMVFDSVPVVQGKATAKRLRLFGVNMDCPISESDECDILSSTTLSLRHHLPPQQLPPPESSALQPNYSPDRYHHDDYKGKGSMSLDLDI